jgi:hypothetical protein
MSIRSTSVILWLALGVVGAAGLTGCGPRVVERETTEHGGDNLFALSKVYGAAQEKLKRPPRSAEELKPYAKEFGDLDTLLVSPNDHQPYVVAWGFDLANSPDPMMVVAYEKTGAGGVRYALTPTGVIKLTEEEFARAHFPPAQKASGK